MDLHDGSMFRNTYLLRGRAAGEKGGPYGFARQAAARDCDHHGSYLGELGNLGVVRWRHRGISDFPLATAHGRSYDTSWRRLCLNRSSVLGESGHFHGCFGALHRLGTKEWPHEMEIHVHDHSVFLARSRPDGK